LPLANTSL